MSQDSEERERPTIWGVSDSLLLWYYLVFAVKVSVSAVIFQQGMDAKEQPFWPEGFILTARFSGTVVILSASSTIVLFEVGGWIFGKLYGFWVKKFLPAWRSWMVLGRRLVREVQKWREEQEITPKPVKPSKEPGTRPPPPLGWGKPDAPPDVPSGGTRGNASPPPRGS